MVLHTKCCILKPALWGCMCKHCLEATFLLRQEGSLFSLMLLLSTGLWHGRTSSSPSTCPCKHLTTKPAHQMLNLPSERFEFISSLSSGYCALKNKTNKQQATTTTPHPGHFQLNCRTFTVHNMDGQSQSKKKLLEYISWLACGGQQRYSPIATELWTSLQLKYL